MQVRLPSLAAQESLPRNLSLSRRPSELSGPRPRDFELIDQPWWPMVGNLAELTVDALVTLKSAALLKSYEVHLAPAAMP